MHNAYTAQFLRAFKQAPWRTQTQAVAAWSITLLIIAVLGGLYLSAASRAGTAGRDLQSLEARKAELIRENDELRAKLAELRSVTRLANRARELGFIPAQPDQIEYLAVNNYPHAARRDQVTLAPQAESQAWAVAQRASTGLGSWLSEAFGSLVIARGGGR